MPPPDLFLELVDPKFQGLQLLDDDRQSGDRSSRQNAFRLVLDHGRQLSDVLDALGHDDAKLGKVAAQGIDQHGALADEQASRPVQHQHALLLRALDRNEAHRRPGHCLADRFGVGRIILLPLDVRFHIVRWHEAHVVAKASDLTRPMMRAAAGFHADHAGWKTGKELQQLVATHLLADDDIAVAVDAVHLKHVLCQIETDCRNVH